MADVDLQREIEYALDLVNRVVMQATSKHASTSLNEEGADLSLAQNVEKGISMKSNSGNSFLHTLPSQSGIHFWYSQLVKH